MRSAARARQFYWRRYRDNRIQTLRGLGLVDPLLLRQSIDMGCLNEDKSGLQNGKPLESYVDYWQLQYVDVA